MSVSESERESKRDRLRDGRRERESLAVFTFSPRKLSRLVLNLRCNHGVETTGIVDPGSQCHGTVMAMVGSWCPGSRRERASPASGQKLSGQSGNRDVATPTRAQQTEKSSRSSARRWQQTRICQTWLSTARVWVDNSHMQELEMFRILFNQMKNPDPEPETQELLVRKHKVELDNIYAKREKDAKCSSQRKEEGGGGKVTARKRQELFRTVTWNLSDLAVLGLRENDDAVGCDAPAGNLQKT